MSIAKANAEVAKLLAMTDDEREDYFMKLPPDGTSTILVKDLEEKPQTPERDKLIKDAKGLWYDDFKSINPAPCSKVALYHDLVRAGYHDLANNVVEGKYD